MKTHLITLALAGICTCFIPSVFAVQESVISPMPQVSTAKADYKIYVGKYQMNPNRVLTISEEDGQLFGEPTSEQKVKLHPESEHVFTIKELKGKVTFIVDANGEVTQALINLQNKDMVAKKLEEK
jgi:hypothetical protein